MGFKNFEKTQLLELLRDPKVVNSMREADLPEDIMNFLKNDGLLKQIRDYAIIPLGVRTRKGKPENIIFTWFMNTNFDFVDTLRNIGEILTPPFRILVDFSMIIQDKEENLRYNWAQRNLNCNTTTNIRRGPLFQYN